MNKLQEKLIFQKLLKIAENQQKILVKLAQAQDPLIAYLAHVAQIAGANSNPPMSVLATVSVNPGSNEKKLTIETTYTVAVRGVPENNNAKNSFMDTFNRQIRAQKPELDGKVSIVFTPGKLPA